MPETTYALVIGTKNRAPGPNYLDGLLANLERAGVWRSRYLHSGVLDVVDGGSPDLRFLTPLHERSFHTSTPIQIHYAAENLHGNDAFCHVAEIGLATMAPWIVSIEDDTHPCVDFLVQIHTWRVAHASCATPMMPLYSAYPELLTAAAHGETAVMIRRDGFYGTQCLLWERVALLSYVRWYRAGREAATLPPGFWDILCHQWLKDCYPDCAGFLTPTESMVQHIGRHSALGLNANFHQSLSVRDLI